MDNLKRILMIIGGIILFGFLFYIFFHVFVFLVFVFTLYYIYYRFFKKKTVDNNKKVNPVIIDIEEE